MKTIVIGAGYFGINYIRELGANLVAVVECDKERAEYVENKYNVSVFPDIQSVSLNYDAGVIVTPPDSHVSQALELVKQGKFVLIEKPMAHSVEELFPLRKYSDLVMAGQIYLYNPMIDELEDYLLHNPVDHVFTRRTNDGPVRSWGNAMWDLAYHDVSILNYLLGTPHYVETMKMKDWAIVKLNYPTIETLTYVSWLGGPKIRTVELVPAEGGERFIYDDVRTVHRISPLRLMLDDFLSGEWDAKCSYEAGLQVINILEKG